MSVKFIHLQEHPGNSGNYCILDGVHRFNAYKGIGIKEVAAEIINLNGEDPILYAVKQAIGPRQLTEEETRNAARAAYQNNNSLTVEKIGKSIRRTSRMVNIYISDLRATVNASRDLKIFLMNQLGIPQNRISARLDIPQKTVFNHLQNANIAKMAN